MTDTAQDLRSALEPCPDCGGTTDTCMGAVIHADRCPAIAAWNRRALAAPATDEPVTAARMLAGEGKCGDRGVTLCPACSLPAHELTQVPGCGAPMQRSPALTGDDDEKAEVTQADRDMAADVLFHVDGDPFVDNIREGWEDDSYLVQAFARHRIAALFYPPAAEPVGLREALEAARDVIQMVEMFDKGTPLLTFVGQKQVERASALIGKALATPARTDDAAQAGGDVAAMRDAIRNAPYDQNDDYPDVRRDERERIIGYMEKENVQWSTIPNGTDLAAMKRAEQAIGAAISNGSLQSAERAYNTLRDLIDRGLATQAAYPTGAGEGGQ